MLDLRYFGGLCKLAGFSRFRLEKALNENSNTRRFSLAVDRIVERIDVVAHRVVLHDDQVAVIDVVDCDRRLHRDASATRCLDKNGSLSFSTKLRGMKVPSRSAPSQ